MPFSQGDTEKALVACGRHCCLCHKFCGTNIELHHIIPASEGGTDVFDNAIPLCFDCHAEVKHYNPQHPRGRKFTERELRMHRDGWYTKVATSGSTAASTAHTEMDRILFSKIRELLPSDSDTINFLRDTDLGGSFELELLNGLQILMRDSLRPEFEFMDAEIESRRARLVEATRNFLAAVAQYTFPCSGMNMRNEIPPEWRETNLTQFFEAQQKLNDLATDLYDKYGDFVRTGRRRLGVS